MANGNGLGITLPPQAIPGKESFDISPRPLAEWVSNLPTANIGETTKLLYRALHEVNRQRHDWKRRYRFLEAIRAPLDAMQRALSQRYAGVSFPLPAKTWQVATLSQRLHLEMATGYMAAIEGMLDSLFVFHDSHALKVMVHRASRHLGQSLLSSYQVYGQQASGTWQQLHRLYSFAETRDFHQDPVEDTLFTDLPESSIARVYKQAVLLATASPYRMRQGEALAIHRALGRWAAHAKLLAAPHQEASHALFALHLDSDAEPEYRSLDHLSCDSPACRLIDLRQMVSVVREESEHAEASPRLPLELFKQLLQGWEATPTRSERRNEGGDSIEVVIGMVHIHQLLAPAGSPAEAPPLPRFGVAPAPHPTPHAPQRRTSDDPWNPYAGGQRIAPGKPDTPQPAAASPAVAIWRWQIINESVGGFRLAVPEGQEAAVRVGEVLAVREEHSPERWHLTVVRWIRHFEQGLFEAGVQIIASDVLPVMVKNITPGKTKGEFQRGLLLPEAPERNQPATLFTANRLFHPSEKVLLHVSGHQLEIVLGNAIQDSGSFVQFEFHAGEKKNTAPDGQGASAPGSPFEMLWGQL